MEFYFDIEIDVGLLGVSLNELTGGMVEKQENVCILYIICKHDGDY